MQKWVQLTGCIKAWGDNVLIVLQVVLLVPFDILKLTSKKIKEITIDLSDDNFNGQFAGT